MLRPITYGYLSVSVIEARMAQLPLTVDPKTGMLKMGGSHYQPVRLFSPSLDDLEEMARIERSSFGDQSYRKELIEQLLSDQEFHNVIVEVEGKKVGYATFFEDDRRKRARLITIAVMPNYRNQGLAKAMLAFLEKEIVRLGLHTVSLEVGASNAAAMNLYLSIGYRIEGSIPNYYGKGKDAMYMEKPIREVGASGANMP
jgi:ribosomal-protein-alanine N-acetyltransferase